LVPLVIETGATADVSGAMAAGIALWGPKSCPEMRRAIRSACTKLTLREERRKRAAAGLDERVALAAPLRHE
jgi:hypothetical protein